MTVTVTDSKVTGIAVTDSDLTDAVKSEIAKDFGSYFDSNTATKLKYYTTFTFSGGNFTGSK